MQGVDPLVRMRVVRHRTGSTFEAGTRRGDRRLQLVPLLGRDLPPLVVGEELDLRRTVPGDATYEQPVVVVAAGVERATLEAVGQRRRVQQRAHVRTRARGARAVLQPLAAAEGGPAKGQDDATCAEHEARVLDVSAGGMRLAHPGGACPPGSRWRAHAALPSTGGRPGLDLDLVVQVLRSHVDGGGWTGCGVRFVDVPARVDQRITQWVFREQARGSHVGRTT